MIGSKLLLPCHAPKQVTFKEAERTKILLGASELADAVRVTLEPKSKSVLIGGKVISDELGME